MQGRGNGIGSPPALTNKKALYYTTKTDVSSLPPNTPVTWRVSTLPLPKNKKIAKQLKKVKQPPWTVTKGKLRGVVEDTTLRPQTISKTGRWVVARFQTVSNKMKVNVLDTKTGKKYKALSSPSPQTAAFSDVTISPNGKLIAFAVEKPTSSSLYTWKRPKSPKKTRKAKYVGSREGMRVFTVAKTLPSKGKTIGFSYYTTNGGTNLESDATVAMK